MRQSLKIGGYVIWRSEYGYAHGTIVSIDDNHTEITRGGKNIHRNGTSEDPAVTIRDRDSRTFLKLLSEVEGNTD